MSNESTFSIVTIVKDDPITGVEYGTANVPYKTHTHRKTKAKIKYPL